MLAAALERFSCFFHSPLFSQSNTTRELNAVDAENKKNLQDDKRRTHQVSKHLSKPGHVWSKFGTGNKVTLTSAARKLFQEGGVNSIAIDGCASFQATTERPSATLSTPSVSSPPIGPGESLESDDDASGGAIGRETRRRLIEWWSKEYCSGRMRLCVIGKGVVFLCLGLIAATLTYSMYTWVDSLDCLSELAATLFSPIPNRGQVPLPSIPDHPFGPEEKGVRFALIARLYWLYRLRT